LRFVSFLTAPCCVLTLVFSATYQLPTTLLLSADARLVEEGVVFRAEDKRLADWIPVEADTAAKATAAVAASLQEVLHSALFVFFWLSIFHISFDLVFHSRKMRAFSCLIRAAFLFPFHPSILNLRPLLMFFVSYYSPPSRNRPSLLC
jgi:hypothetical protein